jgi:cytochrome c-type protein NapB
MKKIALATLFTLPVLLLADMDRCVYCHGVDFEKKALGVSKVVKNMSEKEIKAALDGYKQGKADL